METLGLKNVNMLSKAQYDGVAEPATDELWAVEVETYSDDDGNWYRVYPDGWCEQGGMAIPSSSQNKTITFLKPFKDTLYTVLFGNSYTQTATATSCVSTSTKTTTGFTLIDSSQNTFYTYWEAKGYIDKGE